MTKSIEINKEVHQESPLSPTILKTYIKKTFSELNTDDIKRIQITRNNFFFFFWCKTI